MSATISRQRHRFDHDAAKLYYVELPKPRRFSDVAVKFGVSDTTIRKAARLEGWVKAANEADERVARKGLEASTRTREARAAQNARILDSSLERIEAVLTPAEGEPPPSDEFVLNAWRQSSRDYRLDIGEATDNVAVATVQAGFREAQQLADELVRRLAVDDGLAGEALVRAFRSSYPVQLVERLALIEGGTE